ncbi:MAG: hypothetical protein IJZ74_12310 [Clostridia bacterium]|nr:hypothetical protein [Clostridia bacterium]
MMNATSLEQYRNKIRRRMNAFRAGWLFYVLLVAARNLANERFAEHPAFSGLMGFMVGGLLVGIIGMGKLHKALKDDTALRRLYNKEHDERMQAIRAKAGVPVTLLMGAGLQAAGLVATFFDMTVALTLIAAGLAVLLVTLALKAWYSRRM